MYSTIAIVWLIVWTISWIIIATVEPITKCECTLSVQNNPLLKDQLMQSQQLSELQKLKSLSQVVYKGKYCSHVHSRSLRWSRNGIQVDTRTHHRCSRYSHCFVDSDRDNLQKNENIFITHYWKF